VCARFVDLTEGMIHHADGAVYQRFADIEQSRHVGNLLAHQTKIGDHFIERLTLLCIRNCVFKRNSASSNAHSAQLESPDVQNVERNYMPLADFAEQVLDRHLAIIENDRAGRRAADAEFVLLCSDREAGETSLDQECCEFLPINFRKYR